MISSKQTSHNLSNIVAPHFFELHKLIKKNTYTHYWLSGGRGSTKSSFIAIEIILLILRNENINAIVMRKVAGTLRDSVFAQMLWAIDILGLNDLFIAKVSPMEITHKDTGQKILFRGTDDKTKIKSIKVSKGYIGIAWYEELDQFSGMEEIRSLNQSIMRGGDCFYIFYSYNPPKSIDNWVNIEKDEERPNRVVHHSTYLGVPSEWLGQVFLDEAEILKIRKPKLYEHEYLGIATGNGGNVFDNIIKREITDEEISNFDRIYQGADWGYYPDPYAFIRVHYDKARETIYFIDEIYENKLTNQATANMIIEKGYNDFEIICDSSEKKSVADYRDLGLLAKAAVKPPGSVDYGMKWLQKQTIVIDKNRTPNVYREFTQYEYERNKLGDIISGYPDKNNHTIDACRYALTPLFMRRGKLGSLA